jgi:hypothetical protein
MRKHRSRRNLAFCIFIQITGCENGRIAYLHHGDDSQSECANPAEERYVRCSDDILQSICRYCSVVENPVNCGGGAWGHRRGRESFWEDTIFVQLYIWSRYFRCSADLESDPCHPHVRSPTSSRTVGEPCELNFPATGVSQVGPAHPRGYVQLHRRRSRDSFSRVGTTCPQRHVPATSTQEFV